MKLDFVLWALCLLYTVKSAPPPFSDLLRPLLNSEEITEEHAPEDKVLKVVHYGSPERESPWLDKHLLEITPLRTSKSYSQPVAFVVGSKHKKRRHHKNVNNENLHFNKPGNELRHAENNEKGAHDRFGYYSKSFARATASAFPNYQPPSIIPIVYEEEHYRKHKHGHGKKKQKRHDESLSFESDSRASHFYSDSTSESEENHHKLHEKSYSTNDDESSSGNDEIHKKKKLHMDSDVDTSSNDLSSEEKKKKHKKDHHKSYSHENSKSEEYHKNHYKNSRRHKKPYRHNHQKSKKEEKYHHEKNNHSESSSSEKKKKHDHEKENTVSFYGSSEEENERYRVDKVKNPGSEMSEEYGTSKLKSLSRKQKEESKTDDDDRNLKTKNENDIEMESEGDFKNDNLLKSMLSNEKKLTPGYSDESFASLENVSKENKHKSSIENEHLARESPEKLTTDSNQSKLSSNEKDDSTNASTFTSESVALEKHEHPSNENKEIYSKNFTSPGEDIIKTQNEPPHSLKLKQIVPTDITHLFYHSNSNENQETHSTEEHRVFSDKELQIMIENIQNQWTNENSEDGASFSTSESKTKESNNDSYSQSKEFDGSKNKTKDNDWLVQVDEIIKQLRDQKLDAENENNNQEGIFITKHNPITGVAEEPEEDSIFITKIIHKVLPGKHHLENHIHPENKTIEDNLSLKANEDDDTDPNFKPLNFDWEKNSSDNSYLPFDLKHQSQNLKKLNNSLELIKEEDSHYNALSIETHKNKDFENLRNDQLETNSKTEFNSLQSPKKQFVFEGKVDSINVLEKSGTEDNRIPRDNILLNANESDLDPKNNNQHDIGAPISDGMSMEISDNDFSTSTLFNDSDLPDSSSYMTGSDVDNYLITNFSEEAAVDHRTENVSNVSNVKEIKFKHQAKDEDDNSKIVFQHNINIEQQKDNSELMSDLMEDLEDIAGNIGKHIKYTVKDCDDDDKEKNNKTQSITHKTYNLSFLFNKR